MADGLNVDIYSSVMVGALDAEVFKYINLCNIYTKIITFIELTLQLIHIPNINNSICILTVCSKLNVYVVLQFAIAVN